MNAIHMVVLCIIVVAIIALLLRVVVRSIYNHHERKIGVRRLRTLEGKKWGRP
jgi:hypothetical protein